jgi:hypothetical protein
METEATITEGLAEREDRMAHRAQDQADTLAVCVAVLLDIGVVRVSAWSDVDVVPHIEVELACGSACSVVSRNALDANRMATLLGKALGVPVGLV